MLYAHPFAEEMNKTRRMASLGARALAADGWATLSLDLTGCGDSAGDFGEATWEQWRADLRAGWDWLAAQFHGPRWLWGLRAGCLLAAELTRTLAAKPPLLLWQPGALGQAAPRVSSCDCASRASGSAARKAATERRRCERSSPEGARWKSRATRSPPRSPGTWTRPSWTSKATRRRVRWLEVATGDSPDLGPGARAKLARWSAGGAKIDVRAPCRGSAFWQTVEITECPALVEATVAALAQASP